MDLSLGIENGCDDLKIAEERYRLLVETACVFVMHISPEGLITYVNKYGKDVTGYGNNELIGRNAIELLGVADTRTALDELQARALCGDSFAGFEYPIVTKSGEERVFLWSLARTLDRKGKTTGLVVSGIDLTEFRRVQDALHESRARYRDLVDHSVAGVLIIQDNHCVFANKRAEEITGYRLEEIRDMPVWELVHPDDREKMMERAARLLRGEDVQERFEYTALTKNGESRRIEKWATLIMHQGQPAILSNIIDITERHKVEEDRLHHERQRQEFLRDAISAVTQGKLDVVNSEEARSSMNDPQVTVEIAEPKDVPLARHLVLKLAQSAGLDGDRLDEFLLAVGEATVNAIKHGVTGSVYAGMRDGRVWVGVDDQGPGMDSMVLTRAVSGRGFSTKPSLGLGYTFILDGADHVMLSTSPNGTTVILEKRISPAPLEPTIDLSRIPSPW